MRLNDFNYILPHTSIAFYPPKIRGNSRLLVLKSHSGEIKHARYTDLIKHVEYGDVVVLNNTRVIKARLNAVNNKNQKRELLLLETHHNESPNQHRALYHGKMSLGETLYVAKQPLKISKLEADGIALLSSQVDLLGLASQYGSVPLPPYLKREPERSDVIRYQTEFATQIGSVAAPTASLNFTHELAAKIKAKGAEIAYLTLHVGLGTFLPIRSDRIEDHLMHSEYFEIPASSLKAIKVAQQSGHNVIAIGTTVARTLEYAASLQPQLVRHSGQDSTFSHKMTGEANIFIYPGYEFKVVDKLLTNFHAPGSTVLMLTAAFAGWNNLKHAYEEALTCQYKFLSYGDSMLIE